MKLSPLCFALLVLCSCQSDKNNTLFTKVSKRHTGIDFRNMLKENEDFNIFKYQYFNNGGGLAAGDFNNDGLQDLVFTGNMVKNRLYINKGDLSFDDVTQSSGIAKEEGWCTGVTTVDINQDGWLDIYICRAGYPFKKLRKNLLFINNGDLTFTEKAADYGIDDAAFSTHSTFFDYDNDGDLDLFILNHSTVEYSRGSLEVFQLKDKQNPDFTNKLFRNDNGQFVNVTKEAGISSNVLSFSLGISVTDINDDGWSDIFIANDFNEPDYLFINQKDGTFSDKLTSTFDHTSMYSMGTDVADFNNDGLLDIVSLDMLPESNYVQKMHSGADNYNKIFLLEKNGFFRQSSRNMLQLNNGDGSFSEIGQMTGMSNTDWSWTPLLFDFDNDGKKDLFIANGYPRDHTDMDFLNFTANEVVKINKGKEKDVVDFDGYMEHMPAILTPNYFFHNTDNNRFENKTIEWDLEEPFISQSAIYVDLDNDGDLDLVTNNTADYASVYRNNTDVITENNYLRIELIGNKSNPFGIGAKVRLHAQEKVFYQEQQPVRGFQSSVDPILSFGLGTIENINFIEVEWPSGESETIRDINVNQTLQLHIKSAEQKANKPIDTPNTWLQASNQLKANHKENNFNDFNIQSLIPWFFSRQGPAVASSDINKQGKTEVYLGGSKGTIGQLLSQKTDGSFAPISCSDLEKDIDTEDTDAIFFDADNDGDLDLYIASGGYEFPENAPDLQDRLYINMGNDSWSKSMDQLPELAINSNCVKAADVDGDGDQDLFIGGGYIHQKYPLSYPSYLLINNGDGVFEKQIITEQQNINDAVWADLNGDQLPELIITGEWTPIIVFENNKGQLSNKTSSYIPEGTNGLWNAIHAADFDKDGDQDLVIGNFGLNSQLFAKQDQPLELYYGDYDENGALDPILCYYLEGKSYPFISRDDLLAQLPHLKKKFLSFKSYANAQIQDILTPGQLEGTAKLQVSTLETVYFENTGESFRKIKLPSEIQMAPIHAIQSIDINKDGHLDIILGGNKMQARVKLGRLDGNHVQILLGNGTGHFTYASATETGLKVKGAIRAINVMETKGDVQIILGLNDEDFQLYNLRK